MKIYQWRQEEKQTKMFTKKLHSQIIIFKDNITKQSYMIMTSEVKTCIIPPKPQYFTLDAPSPRNCSTPKWKLTVQCISSSTHETSPIIALITLYLIAYLLIYLNLTWPKFNVGKNNCHQWLNISSTKNYKSIMLNSQEKISCQTEFD